MNIRNVMEQVLSTINIASNAGDSENVSKTKLIGHRPDIAPRAFFHVLYRGLEDKELDILQSGLRTKLPECLNDFYKCNNGMMIYLGSIRVLGYVPLDAKHTGVHDIPSNIIIPNVSARLKGLSPGDIVFAWYKADGSYAVLDKEGGVCRYDVMQGNGLLQRWQDFEHWLLSEINRLQQETNKTT